MSVVREISFDGMEPILVCHGSPNRNNEKMLAGDDHTLAIINQCQQKYILCGHTHIRQIIEEQGKVVGKEQ